MGTQACSGPVGWLRRLPNNLISGPVVILRQGRGKVGAHTFGDGEPFGTAVMMEKNEVYTRNMVPASPVGKEELIHTLAFYQTHDGHEWRQQKKDSFSDEEDECESG